MENLAEIIISAAKITIKPQSPSKVNRNVPWWYSQCKVATKKNHKKPINIYKKTNNTKKLNKPEKSELKLDVPYYIGRNNQIQILNHRKSGTT